MAIGNVGGFRTNSEKLDVIIEMSLLASPIQYFIPLSNVCIVVCLLLDIMTIVILI